MATTRQKAVGNKHLAGNHDKTVFSTWNNTTSSDTTQKHSLQ